MQATTIPKAVAMTPEPHTPIRELTRRTNGGLDVRMLWSEQDGGVLVSVTDRSDGNAFCLSVGPDESPRDVFEHPFAYAAGHRT